MVLHSSIILASLTLLPFITSFTKEVSNCKFANGSLQAHCDIQIEADVFETLITVNQCHEPIDVTFIIKESERVWQYTFVSSNLKDSQIVSSLGTDNILLNVELAVKSQRNVCVYGMLSTNYGEVDIINSSTTFYKDCFQPNYSPYLRAITIASLLTVLLAAIGISSFMLYRRKQAVDELVLVDNMETGNYSVPKVRSHLKVRYQAAANKDGLATIIENNFVKEKTPPKN